MSKRILTAILFTSIAIGRLNAQELVTDKPKRFRYYFNGAFGFYFPYHRSLGLQNSGGISAANFQVNYKGNFLTRLNFDQINVKYARNGTVNSIPTNIDAKVQSTQFSLDLGYTLPIKMFSPYLLVGGGALLDVPVIRVGMGGSPVVFTTSSRVFGLWKGALGADLQLSKVFILYLEGQYQSIPFKTDLNDHRLRGFTLTLGFKTPLQ